MGLHGPEAVDGRLRPSCQALVIPSVGITIVKILFLVRALDCAGAERQLVLLAKALANRGHEVAIAVYYSGGLLEKEVDTSRVRLISLEKRSRWDLISFFWTLLRVVRRERPDVLHGWMSPSNLIATLAGLLCPSVRVFWCIRCDLETFQYLDRVETTVNWLERRLSRFTDCIVVNSRAGFNHSISRGFPPGKMIHIPNGIDVNGLYPDPHAGEKMRTEWGFTKSERLIGLVARIDPIKGHAVFLKAAARLAQDLPEVRFVCLGNGPTQYWEKLQALSRELGLEQRMAWFPPRPDVRAIYNALDVVCLPSLSEGFPNVVGEAMACGRHCVVTNVGDSSFLVGDAGVVVPPNDPQALAEGLRQALSVGRSSNERGRQRILEHFTVSHLADQTEEVLLKFSSDHRPAKRGRPIQEPMDSPKLVIRHREL
jgi:glycosyltransferase involved in cell wall biosynthesis